jgi:tripartite-type tricarboxylate transporter receptor subunit TctC
MVRLYLTLLLGACVAHPALAQSNWPERPIRFIVPFTAGSSSDTVARIVGQKLGERLGQQLVVENRVGGGGTIGTEMVARAEADGYVLGLANTSTHAVAVSAVTISYDPVKDFAPVAMLGDSPFLLALYPGLPAKTVPELIALAKAKPRALNYASAGPATLAHLSGALFEKMANIELTHVPYRGTAQSTVDLMEGRVEMQFGTIPPTLVHVRAGSSGRLPSPAPRATRRCRMCRPSPKQACRATNPRSGRRSWRPPPRRRRSSRGSTERSSPC